MCPCAANTGAVTRAAARKATDRTKRTGTKVGFKPCAAEILAAFAEEKKNYVVSQYLAARRHFERSASPGMHETTASEAALSEFEAQ